MSIGDVILMFANSHNCFTLRELSDHVRGGELISDSAILWHVKKLIKQKKLSRLSRGHYGSVVKIDHNPTITDEMKQLYADIASAFPLIDIEIYSGRDITALQHHVSANNAIYIEVSKDATEAVFHYLINRNKKVYHKPGVDFMSEYVDLSEKCIIVKTLVTEAPVIKKEGLCLPTLEKLLVDINKDPDFYYIQGVEAAYIMDNAQSLYHLNTSRLLRYASRRGIREKMEESLLNNEK